MRRLFRMVARAWERRRTRRQFARLRIELEALNERIAEQPWWSELPPGDR